VGFFRENYAKDGNFVEGWSEALAKDYPRLAAKGATAKSEAAFLKMMDDTIGFASGKRVTRPDAASTPQQIAEYRALVGAPNEAAEYNFKPDPKTVPAGMTWNEEGASRIEALAHKHNVPKEFVAELLPEYIAHVTEQAAKGKEKWEAKINELKAQTVAQFKEEWGEDFATRAGAMEDFMTARGLNMEDPIVKAAVHHPQIAKMIDEAYRASREAPIPGVDKGVFSGSASPRQQAKEIMKAPGWRQNPETFKRVMDLYKQQAAHDRRKAK
jgi:hypothetical protein